MFYDYIISLNVGDPRYFFGKILRKSRPSADKMRFGPFLVFTFSGESGLEYSYVILRQPRALLHVVCISGTDAKLALQTVPAESLVRCEHC